jgi:hypothetical protein
MAKMGAEMKTNHERLISKTEAYTEKFGVL